MGRGRTVDTVIRPVLDALQTIPPFVYLVPALALFGPTRFTAIVAGVVYAAPVAIKLVADGIKAVTPSTIEASRSKMRSERSTSSQPHGGDWYGPRRITAHSRAQRRCPMALESMSPGSRIRRRSASR